MHATVATGPLCGCKTGFIELARNFSSRTDFCIKFKYLFDLCRFCRFNDQLLGVVFPINDVAHWRSAAAVFSLSFRSGHLVADTFSDNFTFILRKGYQNIEHHAASRGMSVDILCDADKGNIICVKEFAQLSKVTDRPAESVNFINNNNINFTSFDIGKQLLQSRTFDVSAGIASVIVMSGQAEPAFFFLAGNIIFSGFPLSVQ